MRKLDENLLNDILEYIIRYQVGEGESPAFSDIMAKFKLSGKSTAHRYIHTLQNRGQIGLDSDGTISIPFNLDSSYTANVALIGEVKCGEPTAAIEDYEGMYKFPKELTGEGEFFMLRAKGDSMINAGICEGDYLIIREQSTANIGDNVVALGCAENSAGVDSEATLKRYAKKNGKYILHPENENYADIDFTGYKIIGKLVGSYRKY